MLFHEIYGTYYAVTAAILKKAAAGKLTRKEIRRITSELGFGESLLTIPQALSDGTWPLLNEQFGTPLRHKPSMPLTDLEKRWMKTVQSDPRVRLFNPSVRGLEDVEPLYDRHDILWFDRSLDSDPFEDPEYIALFRTILSALHTKSLLHIRYQGKRIQMEGTFFPLCLEYSEKDDRFRLQVIKTQASESGKIHETGSYPGRWKRRQFTFNLVSILECIPVNGPIPSNSFSGGSTKEAPPLPGPRHTVDLELLDQRNALERAMLHFSDLEKRTVSLPENRYRIRLFYQAEDETEILIRILSFGPMIRVLSPESFVDKIRGRVLSQKTLWT